MRKAVETASRLAACVITGLKARVNEHGIAREAFYLEAGPRIDLSLTPAFKLVRSARTGHKPAQRLTIS